MPQTSVKILVFVQPTNRTESYDVPGLKQCKNSLSGLSEFDFIRSLWQWNVSEKKHTDSLRKKCHSKGLKLQRELRKSLRCKMENIDDIPVYKPRADVQRKHELTCAREK
eukprot:750077-Hanusia_phi.AAC.1